MKTKVYLKKYESLEELRAMAEFSGDSASAERFSEQAEDTFVSMNRYSHHHNRQYVQELKEAMA